ncbi:hypothetical protein K435DRAFT_859119 [Dendrothele bispora CBS 962.96]|uniref:Uncharacterized protein n=1 Tax=Dendrothele bispora (strain CBS 962.96) TaxID=1314807 RepID=A0A4S8M2H0_DENBC|nr:hypothetical protein K435DRAFT_859119 [Dendrothele bispora CBS 962.96]
MAPKQSRFQLPEGYTQPPPYDPRYPNPADYNAFGFDPRGTAANSTALLFGPNWRPDPGSVSHSPAHLGPPAAPRYGPPANYQLPHLPRPFTPGAPATGYLAGVPGYIAGPAYTPQPQQLQEIPVAQDNPRKTIEHFTAIIDTKNLRKEITFKTDVPYNDFRSRICANLDVIPQTAELAYRIGKLDSTTTVLYFVDLKQQREQKSTRGKKRSRAEDVPPDVTLDDSDTSSEHFKKLSNQLSCEAHNGYCFVRHSGGQATHNAVDIKAMTF